MKKKAKKNQIIITALALMVAVAGYISYTGGQLGIGGKDAKETGAEEKTVAEGADLAANGTEENGQLTGEVAANGEDTNVAFDISEEDIFTDTEDPSLETGADAAAGEQVAQENAQAESGEENQIAGEAVLTSSQPDVIDYASEVKLEREQIRAKNKETLLELINNTNLSEEQKQQAVDTMVAMTSIAEREAATESLLEAKGFQNVVVSITDDTCDVVVNLAGISDAERAQIEDIVKRKAGVSAENIVITPYE
ncbi:MAG: SpoIIIAH-like family protein [Eubacterium sp.]|jgi:hypothetical protein|nr:SpoIIIAH-like family protein [Eubacterium sp.]